MVPPPRRNALMDAEVREKIHLEILKRTGAYHANDHILLSSGQTVRLLTELVEGLGGQVVGVGALWRRTKKADVDGKPIFSLVSRDFPTYPPDTCPLCKKGVPLNQEFVKRRESRKPSSAL